MPVVVDKKVVLFCFRNTIVKEWDSFPGYQEMNRQHTDCGKMAKPESKQPDSAVC